MQSINVNPPINVVGRHMDVTEAMRDHVTKKIEGLHLDYPKIIEAKAILDVQKRVHRAEIILFCANHIVIDASSETHDMYASIDETASKIARRMRKHKTRLLKKQKPRNAESIRYLDESVYGEASLDHESEATADAEPLVVHRERVSVNSMFKEDAFMELELTDRPFVVFHNERRGNALQIAYRRGDGEYSIITVNE